MCPCGWNGTRDKVHECSCKPHEIERYNRKISGPLLDRIDIQVSVPRLEYEDLKDKAAGESSAQIRSRVMLGKYFTALGLSARTHDRIIKVARTIADLAGSEEISAAHIAEAIQLRTSVQR